MGYNTFVTGKLVVKPCLSDSAINDLNLEDEEGEFSIQRGGTEDTVGLVDGALAVIPGDSWSEILPNCEEPYKAYNLDENLTGIVERALKEGCTITGAIYTDGEESPDYGRYRVEGGKLISERPEFLWPNGDKGWGV